MGNGIVSCCDASTSKIGEITLTSSKAIFPVHDFPSSVCKPGSMQMTEDFIRRLESLDHTKLLVLEVLNSGNLPKGSKLYIEPLGLIDSSRKDGLVYFGVGSKEIDFQIPLSPQHTGQHFLVYFNSSSKSYWIRDLARDIGVFLKLDYALVLADNMMVNIGESFIIFNLQARSRVLKIKGPRLSEQVFTGDSNLVISIGRDSSCRVKLEDSLISKVQCTLTYSEVSGWTLADGTANTPSTNGTWLYLNEDFEIYNGMTFKFHETLFQAHF